MAQTVNRVGPTVAMLTAAAGGADLVAVGTRGADWVERLFLGSVATGVLRHAPGAVLVCPAALPTVAVRVERALEGRSVADTPAAYAATLATFAERNAGRLAQLVIYDAVAGIVRVQCEGYTVAGAAYDPHDRRAMLTLHDPHAPESHLTHAIPHVRCIVVSAGDTQAGAPRDRALAIAYDGGEALVTFPEEVSASVEFAISAFLPAARAFPGPAPGA